MDIDSCLNFNNNGSVKAGAVPTAIYGYDMMILNSIK